MKKIFLMMLCGVAMVLTSCENGGNETVKPNFPKLQAMAVEAGKTYDITFEAEKPWTVSLSAEAQQYATLRYEGFTDTQHAGPAGENSFTLNIRSGVGSYADDIVFDVDLTMDGFVESLVKCTIAKSTKVVNVMGGINPGSNALSTLAEGGHPENGPFVNAPYKYTVTHKKGNDALEANFYVQHDVDVLYNYAVYAKNKSGEFVKINTSESTTSWLELVTFGTNGASKFRLYMYYDTKSAVKTEGVGYEAYVNIEDAAKNAMVSIYHVYNPDTEVVTETSFGLANPELAVEKGFKLEGSGLYYTLTIPSAEVFTNSAAAAAFKFTGYTDIYGGFGNGSDDLEFVHDTETDTYYVALSEKASLSSLVRTDVLNISAVGDGMDSYTVNLVFDWIASTNGDDTTEHSVSFINAEVATAAGAKLEKLETGNADYDSEAGVDLQYRLTYTSAELLSTPTSAALNVPGFSIGTVSNISVSGDYFDYSSVLDFDKDSSTGEVLLSIKHIEDVEKVVVPNGSCDLFCAGSDGRKFARILFVLNAPATK